MSNTRTLDKKSGVLIYSKTLTPFVEDLNPVTCSDSDAAEMGRAMIAFLQYVESGEKPDISDMPRQSRIIFRVMEPWKTESEENFVISSKGRRYSAYCKNTKKKDRLDRYQWEVEIDSKKHPEDYQDENAWSQMPTNEDERSLIKLDCNEQDYVELENDIKTIISHLNNVVGKRLRSETKSTQRLIKARLREGYTVDDLLKVIDTKASQWLGTEFEKYLVPSTLFDQTKFEKYINEKAVNNNHSQNDYGEEGVSEW